MTQNEQEQDMNKQQFSHPIESLMKTAMDSIKEMVDVNTVIGDPVETSEGIVIIPVSRVTCGFAAGGGEYTFESGDGKEEGKICPGKKNGVLPFGGGSGAGVCVRPVGFLIVGKDFVRLLPAESNTNLDRLLNLTPQVLSQIQSILQEYQDKSRRGKKGNEDEQKLNYKHQENDKCQ